MSKLKSVNIKAIKHNLRHALKDAAIKNDLPGVAKAAQAIFESGYELEDMGFQPMFFTTICAQIAASGWAPLLTEEMKKQVQLREELES